MTTTPLGFEEFKRQDLARQRWRDEFLALRHRQMCEHLSAILAHATERDPDGEERAEHLVLLVQHALHANDQIAWPIQRIRERVGDVVRATAGDLRRDRRPAAFTYSGGTDPTEESSAPTNRATRFSTVVGLKFRPGCEPPSHPVDLERAEAAIEAGETYKYDNSPLVDPSIRLDRQHEAEIQELHARHLREHVLAELEICGRLNRRTLSSRLWHKDVRAHLNGKMSDQLTMLVDEGLVERIATEREAEYRLVEDGAA